MNNKIDFITDLLKSTKINASQKERLFALATDEIKNIGKSDERIFAEINHIKNILRKIVKNKEPEENNIININSNRQEIITEEEQGTYENMMDDQNDDMHSYLNKQQVTFSIVDTQNKKDQVDHLRFHEGKTNTKKNIHDPYNTIEILKKFKFKNESGLKELVHKPNDIENFTLTDYDLIIAISESYFKSINNLPVDIYYNIKQLILLMSVQGRNLFIETNEHPYLNDLNTKIDESILKDKYQNISDYGKSFTISEIIQNFKRKYRFDSESTEATILKELIKNVFNYNKQIYLREDNLYYTFKKKEGLTPNKQIVIDLQFLNDSEFNRKASFFTWVPNIKKALNVIAADILKHSNVKGIRSFKSREKKIVIGIDRDYNDLKGWTEIRLTIFDKTTYCDRNPNDLSNLIDGEFNSFFTSVCDWSIEYDKNEFDSYQIHFLPINKGIKKLNQKVGGFKHILTFYDL